MSDGEDTPKMAPGGLGEGACPYHSSQQRLIRDRAGWQLRTTLGSDWCILHNAKCDEELRRKYGCPVSVQKP
jgi:hypothetical protein